MKKDPDKELDRLFEILCNHKFDIGRMISGSKSGYIDANPDSVVVFNANILSKYGKVWYGDLDLTKDADKLKEVAEEYGDKIYVLRESDCRFGKENEPIKKLLKKAVWDSTQDIPKD